MNVLDLSRLLPGPLCGQHLADLGAHVTKIEDPTLGDYARPSVRALANRGKEALSLNLKSERGREIFWRLLEGADVVLESFRPGVMDRLGLGYETLAARRPSIVHCAITGYGQTGPRRDAAGHDINFMAVTGVLDQTGAAGGPPVLPGLLVSDLMGGTLTAAMGILAALVEARGTGRGRFVDVSMADAVLAHCVLPLAEYNDIGEVSPRGLGSHTGGAPRYDLYRTRDGRYLAVGAQERKFWEVLCDALGLPGLKARHADMGDSARDVREQMRRAFGSRTAAEWLEILVPLDCCVTPVLRFEEAVDDPALLARGIVREAPKGGTRVLALPLAMSDYECPIGRRSPGRGAHTDEILGRLGYAPGEIETFRADGVV